QHDLAYEEVAEGDEPIEVGVRLLLDGKNDVAAERPSAHVFSATVGGFHQPRPTAGHHRESCLRKSRPDRSGEHVIRMLLAKTSRTEDRHARADKVQASKA